MEEYKNLYWTTEIDSDGRNWIRVTPSTGFGDVSNVKIRIDEDTTYSTATSGVVTFKCFTSDNKLVKSIPIPVCRCICNCKRSITAQACAYGTDEEHMIPESGLTAGQLIFSYSLSNRCENKVTAYVVKKVDGEAPVTIDLRCDGSNAYLTQDLPRNKKFEDVEWSAITSYNGEVCSELVCVMKQEEKTCSCDALVPPKPPCVCDDVIIIDPSTNQPFYGQNIPTQTTDNTEEEKAIIWSEILTNGIPVTGLTSGTIIGTYALSPDDVPCAEALMGHLSGTSKVISLSFSDGNITIDNDVPTNAIQSSTTWVTGVWFDGITEPPCSGTEKTFEQECCSCGSFEPLEFTITEIPITGLTAPVEIGKYTQSECDMFLYGYVQRGTGASFKKPLTFDNGKIILSDNIEANSGKTNRQYGFYVKFNDEENCEGAKSIVQQRCDCKKFSISKTYDDDTHKIPVTGLTSGTTIGTYSLTSGCGDIGLIPEGTISGTPLTFENGNIKLSETIGRNSGIADLAYNVEIKFNSNSNCSAYTINQKACNCTNNIYWIGNETTFSNNGEPSGKTIASFAMQDANGCSYDLMTGTIVERGTTSDLGLELVAGTGTYSIKVISEIPSNTGAKRYFDVNLKYNGTDCHSFSIEQDKGKACNCDDLTIILIEE